MKELTSDNFWLNFWGNLKLPIRPDLNFSADRAIADILARFLRRDETKEAFEIGCAPGKWLVFLHEQYGYTVSGCEYVKSAADATVNNLKLTNAKFGTILCQDFLTMDDQGHKYDIVFSLGFIEHFENVFEIVQKHISILKPGGQLIIGLPNFTGLGRFFQSKIDQRLEENKMLPAHNLDIMSTSFLETIANRFKLRKQFVGYIGGFEPALFRSELLEGIDRFLFRLVNGLLNNALMRKLAFGFYSGYLIGIFVNREN